MYIIYNCKGAPIGNLKGYRTHKGASQQAETRLNRLLWTQFYQYHTENPSACTVYKIILKGQSCE